MESLLLLGIVTGLFLYLAKWGSFILLTSWCKGFRKWVHHTPLALGLLDLLGGYLAGHLFIGSNIGMIAMVTFGSVSMIMIFGSIMYREKVEPWMKNIGVTKQKQVPTW